jgi:hypothetical protein
LNANSLKSGAPWSLGVREQRIRTGKPKSRKEKYV